MADEYLEPILGENGGGFVKLRTIPLFITHWVIAIVHFAISLIFASNGDPECRAYFIMMYLRVAFWIITFVFHHIVHSIHDDHRLRGYHSLHRSTKLIRGAPLALVSLFSVGLMFVQNLMQHYYGDSFTDHCLKDLNSHRALYSPLNYYIYFTFVEFLALNVLHIRYIRDVRLFNLQAPSPDALNENAGSVGFSQQGATLIELLEKQADLIDFYINMLQRMYNLVNGRPSFRVTEIVHDEQQNQE